MSVGNHQSKQTTISQIFKAWDITVYCGFQIISFITFFFACFCSYSPKRLFFLSVAVFLFLLFGLNVFLTNSLSILFNAVLGKALSIALPE